MTRPWAYVMNFRPLLLSAGGRLLWAGVGFVAALGLAAYLNRPQIGDIDALPVLIRQGHVVADMDEPEIPDLPKGATAIAVVEGTVHYGPTNETPPKAGKPCDLNKVILDVTCRAELAEAGGVYTGRLITSGWLRYGDAKRTLPHAVAGLFVPERPEISSAPPAVTVNPSIEPQRWAWGMLAGASWGSNGRPGVEGGFHVSRGWAGGYALGEYQPPLAGDPSDWRAHAGFKATW